MEQEKEAILRLRRILKWPEDLAEGQVTEHELWHLRCAMEDFPSETPLSIPIPPGPATSGIEHRFQEAAARLQRQTEATPSEADTSPRAGAAASDVSLPADEPPVNHPIGIGETPSPLPNAAYTSPSGGADHAEPTNVRAVTLDFDQAELEELAPWTALGDEAIRAFVRAALGNHIFVQRQYAAGADFLLQERAPRAKRPARLRRVRFR